MEYINSETGDCYTFPQLQKAFDDLRVNAFTPSFNVEDSNPFFKEVIVEVTPVATRGLKVVRDGVYIKDQKYYAKWIFVELTEEEKTIEYEKRLAAQLQEREWMLQETDWTQLLDCPLSKEKIVEFKEYRKLLRDITKDSRWPWEHEFPSKPQATET